MRATEVWPWVRFSGLSGALGWGEALQTTLYGAPSGSFSKMPTRNRLPGGLDAGFGTDGPTSVSGSDRGHSVQPRSLRPFSLVSVVTLSLFSI